jgi:hypothetical protein
VDWPSALDALAERVRAQRHAVELHGVVPSDLAGFELPLPEGDIPEHLVVRAMALLDQMREIEAHAGIELGRLRARHA